MISHMENHTLGSGYISCHFKYQSQRTSTPCCKISQYMAPARCYLISVYSVCDRQASLWVQITMFG